MTFLQENVPEVIDWPSCSPDLNPIENIWAIIKQKVEYCMLNNLKELERYMIKEWQAIPESILKNLVDSMRRRCQEVLKKNGELINY